MKKPKLRSLNTHYFRLAAFVIFFSVSFSCLGQSDSKQLHLRSGFFKSNYSGLGLVDPNRHSNFLAINIEYEIFQSSRVSHALRSVISMDYAKAKLMYLTLGFGQRFYLGSQGLRFVRQESNVTVIAVPKLRYHLGYNVGISQANVRNFSASLETSSSLLDFGIDTGVSFAMGKKMSLGLSLGANYGWGFSSVAVTSISFFSFLGMNYSF